MATPVVNEKETTLATAVAFVFTRVISFAGTICQTRSVLITSEETAAQEALKTYTQGKARLKKAWDEIQEQEKL